MTQEATPANVQGDFTRNNSFEYLGVKARMEKRTDGFFMILNLPDGKTQTAKIDRIVGSLTIDASWFLELQFFGSALHISGIPNSGKIFLLK